METLFRTRPRSPLARSESPSLAEATDPKSAPQTESFSFAASFGIRWMVSWARHGFSFTTPCLAVLMMLAALLATSVEAAPVSVRFPEGVTHGFLLVRSLTRDIVGHGEITQMVSEGDLLESQLVFRFKDGSLHGEKVAFSQQRVFTLITYRLVQRGPSFPEQLDVSIDRGSAQYTVRSQRGTQGKEDVQSGQFNLPKDVYNGMLIMVAKNLPKGAAETVSVLASHPRRRSSLWSSTPQRSTPFKSATAQAK